MNKNIIYFVILILVGALSFFAGMEYKSYQVRTAIQEGFKDISLENKEIPEVQEKKSIIIEKNIGDKITFATIDVLVEKSVEENILTSKYNNPAIAKENTKFVVVDVKIKNLLKDVIYNPFNGIQLTDNNGNNYNPSTGIGKVDNYIEKEFQPGIEDSGKIVYEIPKTSTGYYISIEKGGTNEVYHIKLK